MKRLAAAALLLALAACGARGKDQTSVIHRRLDGEPKTLNAILATTDAEQIVVALLSRNLLDYDENLNLVPGLAEEVSDSPDHLVFTVRLKADARWEDGTPVTSADVVFTLNAVMDPKVPALARRSFFEGLAKVEAVDARTTRAARTARSAQSSRGRELARRSTAISCRSTSSSASLEADDRPSRTSQLHSRAKMR